MADTTTTSTARFVFFFFRFRALVSLPRATISITLMPCQSTHHAHLQQRHCKEGERDFPIYITPFVVITAFVVIEAPVPGNAEEDAADD